jgi:DNA repair protein SbcD/Mre11
LKLLCAADLHIGRRPGRLPPPWSGGRISAATAWDGLVACALAEGVDAVLLAGDVVDQDNRFFEAYGPLGRGVGRLKEAGIAVVGVAGNHDHQTLHEVAAAVGQGHLAVLGRGGSWERWTLRDAAGRARLHVDGWSFPSSRHRHDPTRDYALPEPDDDAPVVGLLHCDLDATEPHYAPVPSAALLALPPTVWVLGHKHVPALREAPGRPPVLYPGSLLALDPGETGRRGAWVVELAEGRAPSFRAVALSAVRYESLDVDVEAAADGEALRARVGESLERRLETIVEEGAGPLEVVSCRIRLTGRTALGGRIDALRDEIQSLDLGERDGVRLVVERVDVDTRPALDLEDFARGSDAPGRLARLLLGLDRDPELATAPDLVVRAERAATAVSGRSHYVGLPVGGPAMPAGDVGGATDAGSAAAAVARVALRRQAARLLDALMRQKEAV